MLEQVIRLRKTGITGMFPFSMAKKYKLDRLIYMTVFASRERERVKHYAVLYEESELLSCLPLSLI